MCSSDTPVTKGENITLQCSEVAVNRNTSSFIIWSKNGKILDNQTEPTYTLSQVQFKDSGHYTCNKSGTENKNVVVVGGKDCPFIFQDSNSVCALSS